jgi:homoserine acetyltransferase
MQSLYRGLAGPKELVEISSLYGHDAFLKEAAALKQVFAKAL